MTRISSTFDSGAIDVVSVTTDARDSRPVERIDLRIRRDSHQDFTQWFHFRLTDVRDRSCAIRFVNAGQCTYPGGWDGYDVVASYDHVDWFRVPTRYADGVMTVDIVPTSDTVWFAYFEPYGWERHLALIGRAAASPRVRIAHLGLTSDGRDLDCIDVVAPGASPGRDRSGSSPASIPAKRWPNGSSRACWNGWSMKRTPSRPRRSRSPTSISCPT